MGLSEAEAFAVIAEAYSAEAVRSQVLSGARPVLACFRRAGALGALAGADLLAEGA